MSKPRLLDILNNSTSDVAYSKLNNPVEVTQSGSILEVKSSVDILGNTMLTFKAPCSCDTASTIKVDSTSYDMVDASGASISTKKNAFVKDSLVSVLLDVSTHKAYVQNASYSSIDKIEGLLKSDGDGNIIPAVAGEDYALPPIISDVDIGENEDLATGRLYIVYVEQ